MIDPAIDPEFAGAFLDPRTDDDFDEAHLPDAVGEYAADRADDTPAGRNRLRVLAVYYRLNRACFELGRLDPTDPARPSYLQRLEFLGAARDHLEDVLAPYGFIGEPVMDGVEARQVVFTEPPVRFDRPPGVDAAARPVSVSISIATPDLTERGRSRGRRA